MDLTMLSATAGKGRTGQEADMQSIAESILVSGLADMLVGCGRQTEQLDGSAAKAANEKVGEDYSPGIDPADFVDKIDNKYFPLVPGTTSIYEGKIEKCTERIEVTIPHDTKRIMGVDCVVVKDKVFLNHRGLTEDTFHWYAPNKGSNVWYFAEDKKELHDGRVESTQGSREAGVDGAKPSIFMQADPKVEEIYRQEYYEGEAMNMGTVLSLDGSATVPYGSFDHLLMTKDWNPRDPAAGVAHKYYAPGIGNFVEVYVEGPPERVELIGVKTE
jgi:hypothetical protein